MWYYNVWFIDKVKGELFLCGFYIVLYSDISYKIISSVTRKSECNGNLKRALSICNLELLSIN